MAATMVFHNTKLVAVAPDRVPEPLTLQINFIGAIPQEIALSDLPVHIAVSLPPDIARYTSPIIQLPAHNSSSPNISSIQQPLAPLEPDSTLSERPAFLPLPPTFNYAATNEWADVAQKIQDWLVLSDAEDTAHLRAWGTELFWVAFVAANPTFPRGAWPKWDERVPLEGAFIAKWMVGGVAACFGPVEGDLPSADYLHLSLWRLFSSIVSRQFPDSPPILNVPF